MPVNIFYHRVWKQVFHTQTPSQCPADLRGARLILHPLPHVENVVPAVGQQVRLVHGPLGLQLPSTDADEAKMPDQLLDVVVPPQAGDLEGV